MRDFQEIQAEMDEWKAKIKRAEHEMTFVQSTERPLSLKLQPRWIILFLLAVFFVECMRAATTHRLDVSIFSYVGVGVILVGYVIYVVVMSHRNREYNQSIAETYEEKREIYERLQAQKRAFFEEYVLKTGGKVVDLAESNRAAYLWRDEEELTIAVLGDDLVADHVALSNINYVSSDEKLYEYNKQLGTEEGVESGVPYAYIFTKEKTYIFNAEAYPAISALLPDFELQNKLASTTF